MLFPKQEIIANLLIKNLHQNTLYLSGEMGVGKTYIASYIASKLSKKTLIVCPVNVINKWKKVFLEYCPKRKIAVYDGKAEIDNNIECLIIPQKKLYKYVKKITNNSSDFELYHYNLQNNRENVSNWNFNNYETDFDFIIVDEIHTYKSTHQAFAAMTYFIRMQHINALGLTGTLFDQDLANVVKLIGILNYDFAKNNQKTLRLFENTFNIALFNEWCWQYLAANISLTDVGITKKDNLDINQETMPLVGLSLTPAQIAWQNLVRQTNIVSKQRCETLITNYLDLPENKLPIVKRTSKLNDLGTRSIRLYKFGMLLTPIKIQETAKFKQLKNILMQNPQKTLIFVQDENLCEKLASNLDNCTYLPRSIKAKDAANVVNERLKQHNVNFIVVPSKKITVGVDITTARNIIWYQVPNNVSDVLQANRRVLRLSHLIKSKVWYLYYENTSQADTIHQVASSAINNSALYNVRDDSNLARLENILLKGIEK